MRLSVLLVALVVVLAIIFCPIPASAQHGGGSGGGGGSHASSGGGSSASFSRSTVSTSTSRTSTSRTSTSASTSKGATSESSHPLLKRGISSTPAASVTKPTVCRGTNCPCLGGGPRNSFGNCAVQPQIASCPVGDYWGWNGYGCGQEAFFNDCRQLGDQLAGQERRYLRMRSSREILRYHLLNDQYERCMTAFHFTLPALAAYD
jgi:hypothetical protein